MNLYNKRRNENKIEKTLMFNFIIYINIKQIFYYYYYIRYYL